MAKIMINENTIFYNPRKFNTIELWKDVTDDQWKDFNWQLKNSSKVEKPSITI